MKDQSGPWFSSHVLYPSNNLAHCSNQSDHHKNILPVVMTTLKLYLSWNIRGKTHQLTNVITKIILPILNLGYVGSSSRLISMKFVFTIESWYMYYHEFIGYQWSNAKSYRSRREFVFLHSKTILIIIRVIF